MPKPVIKGYTPEWGSVVGGVRTGQFATIGMSDEIISQLLYVSISGTFTGTVQLERFIGSSWVVVDNFNAPEVVTFENPKPLRMRLHCTALSGGTVSYAIEDVYITPVGGGEKGEQGDPGPPGPSGNAAEHSSRAALVLTSIETLANGGPEVIQTRGRANPADGGHGQYGRRSGAPADITNPAYAQSLDGQWWELIHEGGGVVDLQFGFKADAGAYDGTGTDNYAAFQHLMAYITSFFPNCPKVTTTPGVFLFSDTLEFKGGATTWKGSGAGQAPTSFGTEWLFPANKSGIIIAREDTHLDGLASPATIGGDGTVIEGIHITSLSLGDRSDGDHDGVWCRARATFKNFGCTGFPRDNFVVDATAGGSASHQGNANCFYLENFLFKSAGRHNIYCIGADANAGAGMFGSCVHAKGWGILDNSFLRNTWYAVHTEGNGDPGVAECKAAHHAGKVWLLAYGKADASAITTPGTDPTVWIEWYTSASPDSNSVAWAGQAFQDGGAFAGNALFYGVYAEANQKPCDLADGAIFHPTINAAYYTPRTTGACIQKGSQFHNGVQSSPHDVNGFVSILGGDQTYNTVLTFADQRPGGLTGVYRLRADPTNNNFILDDRLDPTKLIITFTGANSTSGFGRAAGVPYATAPEQLLLPCSVAGKKNQFYTGTAPPGGGEWLRGDTLLNSNAASGQPMGWMCTTGGSPGTWTAMPNLP